MVLEAGADGGGIGIEAAEADVEKPFVVSHHNFGAHRRLDVLPRLYLELQLQLKCAVPGRLIENAVHSYRRVCVWHDERIITRSLGGIIFGVNYRMQRHCHRDCQYCYQC